MNTLSSISPNFTTPTGTQDYMNSEKNLKKDAQNKEKSGTKDLNSQSKLSKDEERLVNALKARDVEVHTHESAHKAAAGSMAGAATLTSKVLMERCMLLEVKSPSL